MPAKKKKSVSPKKAAPKKKGSPAKKAAARKTAAPKKKPAGKKQSQASGSSAAPSAGKTAPAKKARPKKSAARTAGKSESATGTKPKKSKDTPAIFKKVLPKKSGPANFTLEDVDTLLKKKEKDASRKKQAAAKAAPAKRPSSGEEPAVKTERRNLGAASISDILGIPSGADLSSGLAFDEESKVPKKWLKYYRSLVELRDQVNEELQLHASETLKRSSREDSGDLSGYGQHQADAGTETFDRDLALSMVSSEQDALYEIEQAIQRILNGTYGVCEITEKPINKARLAAVPFTRFSVEGQAQWERTNRRRSERGGGLFGDSDEGLSLAGGDDDDDD